MSNAAQTVNERRRELVKGLAASTATALVPSPFITAAERPTAVIVGAGIAGLSAAYELDKAGFDVTIFEKEKFTGGRMVEMQMGPLYQYTHAVGVFATNREMLSLANELGILTLPTMLLTSRKDTALRCVG